MDYDRPVPATTYGNTNTAPAPSVDESASPIRDGICGAEEILSNIHEAINRLERRLDTVLTPAPPTGSLEGKKPTQVASHLSGRVTILNEGFMHAVQRLHDLARRVEV